jgi:hypothetical protein
MSKDETTEGNETTLITLKNQLNFQISMKKKILLEGMKCVKMMRDEKILKYLLFLVDDRKNSADNSRQT